ncbi:hypothetical protein D3C86_1209710 [compost metagenome]
MDLRNCVDAVQTVFDQTGRFGIFDLSRLQIQNGVDHLQVVFDPVMDFSHHQFFLLQVCLCHFNFLFEQLVDPSFIPEQEEQQNGYEQHNENHHDQDQHLGLMFLSLCLLFQLHFFHFETGLHFSKRIAFFLCKDRITEHGILIQAFVSFFVISQRKIGPRQHFVGKNFPLFRAGLFRQFQAFQCIFFCKPVFLQVKIAICQTVVSRCQVKVIFVFQEVCCRFFKVADRFFQFLLVVIDLSQRIVCGSQSFRVRILRIEFDRLSEIRFRLLRLVLIGKSDSLVYQCIGQVDLQIQLPAQINGFLMVIRGIFILVLRKVANSDLGITVTETFPVVLFSVQMNGPLKIPDRNFGITLDVIGDGQV